MPGNSQLLNEWVNVQHGAISDREILEEAPDST